MANIIIIGDLHLGINTDSFIDEEGVSTKTKEIIQNLRMIAKANIEKKYPIIIVGDIFHTNNPKPNIVALFINWLNFLEENNIKTYLISGNHDISSKQNNSLKPICEIKYKNINCFLDITKQEICEENFIFVPYIPKHISDNPTEYIKNSVSNLEKNRKNIIICHHHIHGALIGSEQFMLAGGTQMFDTVEDINLIIAGHIHKRQHFSKSGIPVCYPGGLIQFDISDREDEKGYGILNTDNLTIEYKPSKYHPYKKITIENFNINESLLKELKDHIVHLEINVNKKDYNLKNIKDIQDSISKNCFKLAKETTNIIDNEVLRDIAEKESSINIISMINKKIDLLKYEEVQMKEIKKINESIYNEVYSQYSEMLEQ